jgi:hypothetical protein
MQYWVRNAFWASVVIAGVAGVVLAVRTGATGAVRCRAPGDGGAGGSEACAGAPVACGREAADGWEFEDWA